MKKNKVIISLLLIIIILSQYVESLAKSFELKIYFDGKNISMESETTDMSWNLNNILPGQSDTSSVTITNSGNRAATVITTISIEEDSGLLEMIDLKVTSKDGKVVYTGRYKDLETLSKYLEVGESETYTVETTLNANAGNEYQNKQYKLKFNFKAVGEIPMGTLTIRYVDENGDDIETPTIETKEITEEYNLPAEGKALDGYRFSGIVDGELNGPYKEEGTTVIYHYNKIEYGNLLVKYVSDDEDGKVLKKIEGHMEEGTDYKYGADNIEGYEFNGKIDGKPEGKYSRGITEVTFHYDMVKYGKLIIQCVDMDGVVFEQTSTTKKVGTKYKLSSQGEEKAGYTFVRTEGKLDDEYKEEDTIVKYIYKLNQDPKPEKGRVIILYVDENGDEIERTVETDNVGETYTYTEDEVKKEIPGYVFKKIDGKLTGEYKKEDTIIYCRYEKEKEKEEDEKGNVILIYVDENENIIEKITTTDIVGKPYVYTDDEVKKEIPGYNFKKIEGNLTGKYKKEDTIIYCRYEKIKKGRVIVVCIDKNNKTIKQTIYTENVGTEYDLGKVGEEIEGYTFLDVEGETSGEYTEEDIIVTYKYEKNKAPSTDIIELPKTGQFKYAYVIIGVIIAVLILLIIISKKRDKKENKE